MGHIPEVNCKKHSSAFIRSRFKPILLKKIMELFAPKNSQNVSTINNLAKSSSVAKATVPSSLLIDKNESSKKQVVISFKELGLCNWICNATAAMGYKRPTDIQSACIPAILTGRSVLGCAETGSGKTAAFALPILQQLSIDPYGIFAVILTPTRELAVQIYEQVAAFGSAIGVKQALIIGGVSMTEQSLALSNLPHIVISTPGRLRHHLESADPPNLRWMDVFSLLSNIYVHTVDSR